MHACGYTYLLVALLCYREIPRFYIVLKQDLFDSRLLMSYIIFTRNCVFKSFIMWTHEQLRSRIRSLPSTEYNWEFLPEPFKNLSKAAVLIPLVLEDDTVKVWLTKRSELVRHYKGEASFPGGTKDPGDANAVQTATREASEEIGLDSSEVELVAELPSRINHLKILITPIVGIVSSDFYPKPSDEVSFSFKLPLERFLSKRDHKSMVLEVFSTKEYAHFFQDIISEETVLTWGITAAFAIELACGVFQKSPDYPYSLNGNLMPEDPFRFSRQYMDILKHHFTDKKSKL